MVCRILLNSINMKHIINAISLLVIMFTAASIDLAFVCPLAFLGLFLLSVLSSLWLYHHGKEIDQVINKLEAKLHSLQ